MSSARGGARQDGAQVEDMGLEEIVRTKLRAFFRRVDGYPIDDLYDEVISRVERPLLEQVLEYTGGNQLRAAHILGVNRNTLRKKLSERGLAGARNGHGRR